MRWRAIPTNRRRADEYVALKFQPSEFGCAAGFRAHDALPLRLTADSPWPASRRNCASRKAPAHPVRDAAENFASRFQPSGFARKDPRYYWQPLAGRLDGEASRCITLALRIWFAPSRTAAILFPRNRWKLFSAAACMSFSRIAIFLNRIL